MLTKLSNDVFVEANEVDSIKECSSNHYEIGPFFESLCRGKKIVVCMKSGKTHDVYNKTLEAVGQLINNAKREGILNVH